MHLTFNAMKTNNRNYDWPTYPTIHAFFSYLIRFSELNYIQSNSNLILLTEHTGIKKKSIHKETYLGFSLLIKIFTLSRAFLAPVVAASL